MQWDSANVSENNSKMMLLINEKKADFINILRILSLRCLKTYKSIYLWIKKKKKKSSKMCSAVEASLTLWNPPKMRIMYISTLAYYETRETSILLMSLTCSHHYQFKMIFRPFWISHFVNSSNMHLNAITIKSALFR